MLTTHETPAPPSAPLEQQVCTIVGTLVHDLSQPLSVIEACADYLNLVLPDTDHRARGQLELLQRQVADASRIMHEALLKLHYGEAHTER